MGFDFRKKIKKFLPNVRIGNAYKEWSTDDLELLSKLYYEKRTVSEIAKIMDRSRGAISSQIKHSGLNQTRSQSKEDKITLEDVTSIEINLEDLKKDYTRIRSKCGYVDETLYPEIEILIQRIKNNEHPRLLETLKEKLKQEKIEKELENEKVRVLREKLSKIIALSKNHFCGYYFPFNKFPDEYRSDELTRDIIANKKKYRDDQEAKNATKRIAQKMFDYIQDYSELENIDVIIPVPNYTPPENSRAVSIAKELSYLMGVTCDTTSLKKIHQIPDHLNMGSSSRKDYFRNN